MSIMSLCRKSPRSQIINVKLNVLLAMLETKNLMYKNNLVTRFFLFAIVINITSFFLCSRYYKSYS